ncbi:MAG: NAD(P)/FAD-dependent oxidoreductase [Gemmatimonadaceae bacterium]|nr:NAD(P)/FAD-dependent oxidoreductase [Gemmatimonadaceae bacterium]
MTRPRVVIIGGGFGGLAAAKRLARAEVDVVVIDRTNHHLFQPLLYQVANTSLAPSDISAPIRFVLRRQRNTTVLLGDVTAIDRAARTVTVRDHAEPIGYDHLIVAAGARHSYFGRDEWEPHAPGLKTLEDALQMRRRLLTAFEAAEWERDAGRQRALTTIVVVGGGATGVELAGTIPEFARAALRPDFRTFDAGGARVVLVEGGDRLLPAFPTEISARVRRDLERLGVEVRLQTRVTEVTADGVRLGDEWLAARTVFWAAGNQASPLGRALGAECDAQGRVVVRPDLSLPGDPSVSVVGDLARVDWTDGRLVPGVCPAAVQMGAHAAANVRARLAGRSPAPFVYWNKGELATIGRNRAVAVFPFLRVTGRPAWFLWLFVHILYLVGFRNRLSVLLQWGYAYLTFQRGVRLITAGEGGR